MLSIGSPAVANDMIEYNFARKMYVKLKSSPKADKVLDFCSICKIQLMKPQAISKSDPFSLNDAIANGRNVQKNLC